MFKSCLNNSAWFLVTLVGTASSTILVTAPLQAATFNFNWSNTGPNIASDAATPGSLTAIGTLDINRSAGQTFTKTNLSNINILVTSPQSSFRYTSLNASSIFDGQISSDGLFANITGDIDLQQTGRFFGCVGTQCLNSQVGVRTDNISNPNSFLNLLIYNSPANTRASFQITATPIPFEFSPLGLIGFAGLWAVYKAKKTEKNKSLFVRKRG